MSIFETDLIVDEKRSPRLTVNKDNVLIIPKGYLWCNECSALTPHTKDDYKQICIVCGEYELWVTDCPNCGYILPEEEDMPETIPTKIHNSGCHMIEQSEEELFGGDEEYYSLVEYENGEKYRHLSVPLRLWADSYGGKIAKEFFDH